VEVFLPIPKLLRNVISVWHQSYHEEGWESRHNTLVSTSRDQLATMCQAVVKQLKPGGGFVALTINPQLVPDQLPRVEHYRSGVTVRGPLYEGAPLDVTMLTASGPLHLCDYYWSQATYESVLRQAGFDTIIWHAMQVSAEGFETHGSAYWQAYLTRPHIVVLEAQT
jgi:hypothetical protein